ncbi:hypothetical protein, partial [Allofranklinella schreckenbergeri]|uniref:hypothetical protein n=1 Tax=Allofranklinella schreckenbergeri TaxID=1076744 RepID=UPI001EEE6B22
MPNIIGKQGLLKFLQISFCGVRKLCYSSRLRCFGMIFWGVRELVGSFVCCLELEVVLFGVMKKDK